MHAARRLALLCTAAVAYAAFSPRPSSSPPPGGCSRVLSREAAALGDAVLAAAAAAGVRAAPACRLGRARSRFAAHDAAAGNGLGKGGSWPCRLPARAGGAGGRGAPGECGKAFKSRRWLDAHFDRAHADSVLEGEPCAADLCGVLGCPSLVPEGAAPLDDAAAAAATLTPRAAPPTAVDRLEASSDGGLAGEGAGEESGAGAGAGEGEGEGEGESSGREGCRFEGAAGPPPALAHARLRFFRSAAGAQAPARVAAPPAVPLPSLSPAQAAERAQCAAIFDECFPDPPEAAAAAAAEAAAGGGRGGAPAADPSRALRARASSSVFAARAFRSAAALEYCDAPVEEKARRAAARAAAAGRGPDWATVVVVGAAVFAVVVAVVACLAWFDEERLERAHWERMRAAARLIRSAPRPGAVRRGGAADGGRGGAGLGGARGAPDAVRRVGGGPTGGVAHHDLRARASAGGGVSSAPARDAGGEGGGGGSISSSSPSRRAV